MEQFKKVSLNANDRAIDRANDKVSVQVKVRSVDLPLSCPMSSMSLWDMHPKVYLAMDQHNEAKCPYCGANYVFIDE